jgi:hypothetical protein
MGVIEIATHHRRGTERLILLSLLRRDHPAQWSRTELKLDLYDIPPDAITDALTEMEAVGVVIVAGENIQASSCALRIDALHMICI